MAQSRDAAPIAFLKQHPYLASVALTGATLFVGLGVLSSVRVGDIGSHVGSHVVAIVAAGLFLSLILLVWPETGADVANRGTRYLLCAGVFIFLAGQILEVVGAFGYQGYRRVGGIARLHDVGAVLGPAGLLLAMAGTGLTLVLQLGSRMNLLGSRWVTYGFLVIASAVIAFLIGGFVFGY